VRFLCVSDFVAEKNSGAAGSILAIGQALADRGHEVDFLWKNTEPYVLPHPSLSRLFELPRHQYRQVAGQLEKAAYDVVVISQPYAYLACEKLASRYPKTLFLNRTHGWEDRYTQSRRYFQWKDDDAPAARQFAAHISRNMLHRACLRTLRASDGVVTASSLCARFIESSGELPAGRLAVIPHGLDDAFLSRTWPERTGRGARMLFVGNYLPRKGSAVLEAVLPPLAAAHAAATMTFVVNHDAVDRIVSRFGPAFGDRLTVLPWQDRASLPAIYAAHDITLFPSLFEGFGKVFLEGMACGACVVGFDQGGLPDVAVSGRDALFCETGDRAAFKALLEQCMQNPDLVQAIGQRAQDTAQAYTWQRTAEETEAFCEQLRVQGSRFRVQGSVSRTGTLNPEP
jgi:glycosyltransferase involved in cell wall biosynthesis